ncbi:MAG: DNA mismatch repair protein MutS [Oligoflexales bacterium]|nr:DNA mismatch repair protein MutS [Oligoflexales bacterium]
MPTLPSEEEILSMTPMMQQYYQLKREADDAVLFFRMGDFYEIFGDEAEEIAPLLEIALTSRERGDSKIVKFCGVPHHSASLYWLKLLKLNYRVAVAEQVEEAGQGKGLVRRAIVKILSPGCVDDLDGSLLKPDTANYLMAIYELPEDQTWTVCICDVSTGEFRLGKAADFPAVLSLIKRFQPVELLARRFFIPNLDSLLSSYSKERKVLKSPLPESVLRDESEQKVILQATFGSWSSLSSEQAGSGPREFSLGKQACGEVSGGMALAASVLFHLKSVHACTSQFLCLRALEDSSELILEDHVVRDLELFARARTQQSEGSLYAEICECLSPMGSRLLKWALAHPFRSEQKIRDRQSRVQKLLDLGEEKLRALRDLLKGMCDLERLMTRVLAKNIHTHELARMRTGLKKVEVIYAFLSPHQSQLGESFQSLMQRFPFYKEALHLLEDSLQENPLAIGQGDAVFRPGYDTLLDEKNALSKNGEERVNAYQEQLRQETKINSLKIKQNNNFGLMIEITKTHLNKIPEHFIRRQTMVNCERFTTMELKDFEVEWAQAKELTLEREAWLYQELLGALSSQIHKLQELSQELAEFDLSQGLAWLALTRRFCRPTLSSGEGEQLLLHGARHPIVERYVGPQFYTPNHLWMNRKSQHLVITGPNMAGKSTLMRMVAICAILHQIGSFVPAESAEMPIFDQIFTRVGASDDLSLGLSTFMVEMTETAHILRRSTQHSLVILDEVGRGTSTEDGLALAEAILENIIQERKCWTFFATHYHELIPFAEKFSSAQIVQTEVLQEEQGIRFTHRLIPGSSGSSYGIEVAKRAGIPISVLQRARLFLQKRKASLVGRREVLDPQQRSLFLS